MKEEKKKTTHFFATWFPTIFGLLLLFSAAGHRLQLDMANTKAYTSSPLIVIEMFLVLIMFLILIIQFIRFFYLLVTRQWGQLGFLILNTTIGFASLIGAMAIDAPTLIYMT